jgi:hypothetical protein
MLLLYGNKTGEGNICWTAVLFTNLISFYFIRQLLQYLDIVLEVAGSWGHCLVLTVKVSNPIDSQVTRSKLTAGS